MSIFGTPSKGSGDHISSATSQAATAVNTQSGDLLVAVVVWSSNIQGTASMSDTAGNSFTAGGIQTQSHQYEQFFYKIGATANASNIVTVSVSGSSGMAYMSIYVWSIPVSGGTAVFDVEAGGTSSGLSNTPVTASFNTSGTDEIVLVASGNDFSGITYTAGTGYTLDSSGYAADKLAGSEHQLFSSAQTGITAGFSQSSNTDWTIRAISFKALSTNPISASISGVGSISATSSGKTALTTSILGISAVIGAMHASGVLASLVSGKATIIASLIGSADISAAIDGLSTVVAVLKATGELNCSVEGKSLVSLAFIPNIIQQRMLAICYQARAQGLKVTPDTIVSTAFTWGMVQPRWRYPARYTGIPSDIGSVWLYWQQLQASGLVPLGVVI